jgi:thioredoxin-like negative regulator of GroEL
MDATKPEPPPTVWLACLCAAWCRTCDGYRPVLEQVAAEMAASVPGLRLRWIDIEDESELVGDCDVETFPTLAVVAADGLRFFGPLTPQPETLRRLLRATLLERSPAAPGVPVAAEVAAFVDRLRALTLPVQARRQVDPRTEGARHGGSAS